jgi:uncharacterized protein
MVAIGHQGKRMELRRYKDILALKSEEGTLLAFHARNMEVAQISESTWQNMNPTTLLAANPSAVVLQECEAIDELKTWDAEENPEVRTTKIKPVIRYITINVTQICNLHCTYCAAGGDGTFGDAIAKISIEKTLPQLKFFLERLPETGSFNISFLGGEPLMYAEGLELIAKYVAEIAPGRKVNYTVITNGTLMTDKNVDILARMNAAITISLDGPAEINDRMRPTKNGKSSTAMVVAGLEKLLARKSEFSHLMIHGVFDSNNMQMVKAYEFFSQFAVDNFDFSFSVSDTNPRATQEFMQQMTEVAALAFAKGGETELRRIRGFDQHFVSLDSQRRTENYCGAGKSFLMIDARNQIYTCPWDVNDKKEQVGQGTELDEKALEAYQQPILEQNKCENCWARFLCGGGCMFAHKHGSGQKNIKNTQFCERTRFMVALALIYYERCRSAA